MLLRSFYRWFGARFAHLDGGDFDEDGNALRAQCWELLDAGSLLMLGASKSALRACAAVRHHMPGRFKLYSGQSYSILRLYLEEYDEQASVYI